MRIKLRELVGEDLIPGGKGDNIPVEEVDPDQLNLGIAVEREHTDDDNKASEIARDHLIEDPEYYTKLVNAGLVDEPDAIEIARNLGIVSEAKNKIFKLSDKITYLGKPGKITSVKKDSHGQVYYSVSYDTGKGKTKVSNIYNKGNEIK